LRLLPQAQRLELRGATRRGYVCSLKHNGLSYVAQPVVVASAPQA
jgi:hypothetical protein